VTGSAGRESRAALCSARRASIARSSLCPTSLSRGVGGRRTRQASQSPANGRQTCRSELPSVPGSRASRAGLPLSPRPGPRGGASFYGGHRVRLPDLALRSLPLSATDFKRRSCFGTGLGQGGGSRPPFCSRSKPARAHDRDGLDLGAGSRGGSGAGRSSSEGSSRRSGHGRAGGALRMDQPASVSRTSPDGEVAGPGRQGWLGPSARCPS
jgi:hypothetical protein